MKSYYALAAVAFLVFLGCGRNFDTSGMSLQQIEALADETFNDSDYRGASRLYAELMFSYPGSANSDFYLYRMGMSEAGNHYWADAIFHFEKVQNEFPRSTWSDDCAYETAMVWWQQRHDYRKDLTPVLNCQAALENFFAKYPGSDLNQEATDLQDQVNNYLAMRALFIGRFYARREKYDASLLYLREALNDYGTTDCRVDVLVALGDVYLARGNSFTAKEFYQQAIDMDQLDSEQLEELLQKMDEL